jgi:hypothetical protein
MRRTLLPVLLAAIVLIPIVGLQSWAHLGFAQAGPGPQGDEFNNNAFVAPFAARCGARAVSPCPDAQGPNTWSLNGQQPGVHRIMTQLGSLVGTADQSSNNARNLILQPVSAGADYVMTTRLTFPGTGAGNVFYLGQTAGLLVYQDDDHFIYVARLLNSSGQPMVEFRRESDGSELTSDVLEATPLQQPIYLRITKTGSLYQASYSYDNQTFLQPSPALSASATPTATGSASVTPTSTSTATATTTAAVTNTPTATGTATPTSSPTVTPTTSPTATPTHTATPTATATGTSSTAGVVSHQAGSTATPTPTATSTPAPTGTPLPTGYLASYTTPQVGLFAWGGTNTAVSNSVAPADFDWFRVGNSQVPVPSPTPTFTGTAPATGTSTATSTPAPTSTATRTPTATATNTPATTSTPKPRPKAKGIGYSYVSVSYHLIRIGTNEHVRVRANRSGTDGIWVTVQFATGLTLQWYQETDSSGFWRADFKIPKNTISTYSHQAVVTFQLWRGIHTRKNFSTFTVVR